MKINRLKKPIVACTLILSVVILCSALAKVNQVVEVDKSSFTAMPTEQAQMDGVKTQKKIIAKSNNITYPLPTWDNTRVVDITNSNVMYENASSPQIVLKKEVKHDIDIHSIIHEDKYLDGYYNLILPGDYSTVYRYGTYKINDNYLENMMIENNNGKTQLKINQKNIYVYKLEEDEQNIYINLLKPKDAYKYVVVIDPGHGGHDPGNVGENMKEKEINLAVSNKLYALLQTDPDIKAYATRTTDVYPSFDARTGLANQIADMFVSIHTNAFTNNSVNGVQLFYPNPADTRGEISQQFSKILMDKVVMLSGMSRNSGDRLLGYKLKVLRDTMVPACLVEMGFMTNSQDAARLTDPNCQQAIAQGLYEAIKEAFSTIIPIR
jgi:N-acetylmuramoyl-L-alanine amidase